MSRLIPRIFEIPELAHSVNAYLKPGHSVRLACSNRSMFDLIMPLLWKRVNGMLQFFPLFPSLENPSRKGSNLPAARPKKPVPSLGNFSRFDKYAPWVEHLEMYRGGFDHPSDEQLDMLYRYSAAHVLFPNLRSITSMNPVGHAAVAWILPLLSPSLISLEMGPISCELNPDISTPAFSVLLNALSKQCPSLRTLVVPVSKATKPEPDVSQILQHTNDEHKSAIKDWVKIGPGLSLVSIGPLTNFTTSDDILDASCISCIGDWPLLERLEIVVNVHDDSLLSTIPEATFPSLKHLGLYGIRDKLALNMFQNATVLLGKLNSVKLIPPNGPYVFQEALPPVLQLLSVFAKHGPRIQNLWLRVCDPDHLHFATPISALSVLRQLPLQVLYIEGIYLTGCNNVSEWLITAFPALRELGLPSHCVRFADLQEFRDNMPKLQLLSLGFEPKLLLPDSDTSLNDVERHCQSSLHTLEVAFCWTVSYDDARKFKWYTYHEIIRLVRHIFVIWPNVQIVEKPDTDSFLSSTQTPELMMHLINTHLAHLSWCNRDPTTKYEDVNILNKESWGKCQVLTQVLTLLSEPLVRRIMEELNL
ncbi:hypothetical protein FS749_003165 [Ceratobasidium sp. UAMH 11750]|nr:hypothetical protein FS749_003165 [Ceratobasidium sp. UAMH 11750]